MKNTISTLLLCLCLSLSATAQPPHNGKRMSPDEFRQKMERVITNKARLTPEESAKLFPLFHEMKQKQHSKGKQLFKLRKMDTAAMTEKDVQDHLLQIKRLQVEMAQIEETYYKRMCKVVSAHKVMVVMAAEDEFHKDMLERFNRGHKRK